MDLKIFLYSSVVAVAVASFVPAPVYAQDSISAEELLNVQAGVSGTIQHILDSGSAAKALKNSDAIAAFYAGREYEPFWVGQFRAKSVARDMAKIVEQSWRHGLNPYSYHLEQIHQLIDANDQAHLAELDVLMSDAYVRLGQDLSGIRVNPSFMKSNIRYWKAPFTAETLLERLDQERNAERIIEGLEPKGQTYKHLQDEFVRLLEKEPEPYEAVLPIRVSGLLKPNQRDKSVPDLRTRLGVEPQTEDEFLYDDRLAAAVIQFQRDNHLKDDGIVGGQTLEILNQSREQKILQIIANLERLRWVEEKKPEKFVVVNIPSAMLWAVDDGKVEFEMEVIVGRKQRATNIFRTEITGVRFNPDWTVPPTIKRDDILPRLREDPEYLNQKGMQLISGRGSDAMTLDPTAMDWENITQAELRDLRMVQVPGARNPLGRIRVLMPNGYNIYLHDTNEPHYFERANRAASSGCIRMKDPERMANFIMRDKKGWDEYSADTLITAGKMRDVFIQETIPVYLLYYTVWLDDTGSVVYGRDLYEFDADLIKMLRDIDGFFIPVDNT